jgi:hypothetical protein
MRVNFASRRAAIIRHGDALPSFQASQQMRAAVVRRQASSDVSFSS